MTFQSVDFKSTVSTVPPKQLGQPSIPLRKSCVKSNILSFTLSLLLYPQLYICTHLYLLSLTTLTPEKFKADRTLTNYVKNCKQK